MLIFCEINKISILKLTRLLVWRFSWALEMYKGNAFSPLVLMSVTFLKSTYIWIDWKIKWSIIWIFLSYLNNLKYGCFEVHKLYKICNLNIYFLAQKFRWSVCVYPQSSWSFITSSRSMNFSEFRFNYIDSVSIEIKWKDVSFKNVWLLDLCFVCYLNWSILASTETLDPRFFRDKFCICWGIKPRL